MPDLLPDGRVSLPIENLLADLRRLVKFVQLSDATPAQKSALVDLVSDVQRDVITLTEHWRSQWRTDAMSVVPGIPKP